MLYVNQGSMTREATPVGMLWVSLWGERELCSQTETQTKKGAVQPFQLSPWSSTQGITPLSWMGKPRK